MSAGVVVNAAADQPLDDEGVEKISQKLDTFLFPLLVDRGF